MLPEPKDVVCGQQRAYGDIALWANEEAREFECEESGQGKIVSDCLVMRIVEKLTKSHRSLSLRDVRDIKRLYLSGMETYRDCLVDDETDEWTRKPAELQIHDGSVLQLGILRVGGVSIDEPSIELFIAGSKRAGAEPELQFFGGRRTVGGPEPDKEVEHNRIKGERDERVDQDGAEDGGD